MKTKRRPQKPKPRAKPHYRVRAYDMERQWVSERHHTLKEAREAEQRLRKFPDIVRVVIDR